MIESRFRWVTLQRALDVLVADFTNATMVAFIEEIGCGPDFDRLSASDKTTPKLRNLLSRVCRDQPPRVDTEGSPLADRIVREAATRVPSLVAQMPWQTEPQTPSHVVAQFINSLAVDGWGVEDGRLTPNTSVPIAEPRSRVRNTLQAGSAVEALRRLDQLEKGLDEGHWESANGDARGFLNAVFEAIAERHPQTQGKGLREGAARTALQQVGFFRTDPKDPNRSLEGRFISALVDLLGSEGAHTGSSDPTSAVFRYAVAVITADYFVNRAANP